MFGKGMRRVGGREFADAVVAGIDATTTHLYLMFQADGSVTVKWESPRGDRRRPFRIVADGTGNACPHCAVLLAIDKVGAKLPLWDDQVERVRGEYLSVIKKKLLPCPAFGRAPSLDTPFGRMPLVLGRSGWNAECHVGDGDPGTPADCARHR